MEKRVPIWVLLLFFPLGAMADTVWLKNGDKLSGSIRLLDSGKLLLKTPYAGTIKIDWDQVATLESDNQLLVKMNRNKTERAQKLTPSDSGQVILENDSGPQQTPLARVDQIQPPKPLVEDLVWSGRGGAAMDYKREEKDTSDYDLYIRSTARHGKWRHEADAEYERTKKDSSTTKDSLTAEYALDRFMGERWFWQGRAQYNRDRVEELRYRKMLGTGPGFQFWDDELGAFSLTSLINQMRFEYQDGSRDDFQALGLKWDYSRKLFATSMEVFSFGQTYIPTDGAANYGIDASAGLRYKLTEWASLDMKASKELITGARDDLNETRYTLGVGIGW